MDKKKILAEECPVRDKMLVEKKINPHLRRLSRQGQNIGHRENISSLTGLRECDGICRSSTNILSLTGLAFSRIHQFSYLIFIRF